MNEATANIDFNSEEHRRRVAEKQAEAIRLYKNRPRPALPPRVLTDEEHALFREAARLGAEWRQKANQEGW